MKSKSLTHSKQTKQMETRNGFQFSNAKRPPYKTASQFINKEVLYTSFLYLASVTSIIAWLISLITLPFGDLFQFVLGAIVLTINLLIFKWSKI